QHDDHFISAPAQRSKGVLGCERRRRGSRSDSWWVGRLISSGQLRAVNIGGTGKTARWRIDPEDLAWVDRDATNPTARPDGLVTGSVMESPVPMRRGFLVSYACR